MIQRLTVVKVADNSGARTAKVVGLPGYSKRRWAHVGDIVVVAVQEATPNSAVQEHQVHKGVIVRTRKELKRKDGSYVRFDDNAIVLIDVKKAPKGSRVFGPVARELKDKGFDKIISLAGEVL